MILYLLDVVLFLIGLYALLNQRNLIKKVIGFGIMDYAVNLLFILIGYKAGGNAPILSKDNPFLYDVVDPLPQALILTSIVIGLGVTALMVGLCLRIYQHYGTFDIEQIRRLKE